MPDFLCAPTGLRPSRRSILAGLGGLTLMPKGALAGLVPLNIADDINALGDALMQGPRTNVVVAPHNLHAALTMLALAADERTARKLESSPLLGNFDASGAALAHAKLLEGLAGVTGEGLTLTNAAAVWLRDGAALLDAYKQQAAGFGADVRLVDFTTPAALQAINGWVSDKTKGLIPKILEQVDAKSEAALTTAMYFKGLWKTPFEADLTRPGPFKLRDGKSKDVPMMHAEVRSGYWEDAKYKAVALDYLSGEPAELQLVVLKSKADGKPVPARGLDLSALLAKAKFEPLPVGLSLPKLSVAAKSDMEQALTAAGYGAVFGRKARYDKITGTDMGTPVVTHAVKLDLDEKGTEAAAATAITGLRSSGPGTRFAVDAPYVFAIRHVKSGVHLLQGRIEDPTAA